MGDFERANRYLNENCEWDVMISGINIVLKGKDSNESKNMKMIAICHELINGVEEGNPQDLKDALSAKTHRIIFFNVFLFDQPQVNSPRDSQLFSNVKGYHAHNKGLLERIPVDIYMNLLIEFGWCEYLSECLLEVLYAEVSYPLAINGVFTSVCQYANSSDPIASLLDVVLRVLLSNMSSGMEVIRDTAINSVLTAIRRNKSWFVDTPNVTVKVMLLFIHLMSSKRINLDEEESFTVQIIQTTLPRKQLVDASKEACKRNDFENVLELYSNSPCKRVEDFLRFCKCNYSYDVSATVIESVIASLLESDFQPDVSEISVKTCDNVSLIFAVYDVVKFFRWRFLSILDVVDEINCENSFVTRNKCCAELYASSNSRIKRGTNIVLSLAERDIARRIQTTDLLLTRVKCRERFRDDADFVEFDKYVRDCVDSETVSRDLDSDVGGDGGAEGGSEGWRKRLSFLESYIGATPETNMAKRLFESPEDAVYRLLTTYTRNASSAEQMTTTIDMICDNPHVLLTEKSMRAFLDFCHQAMDDSNNSMLLKLLREAVTLWPLPLLESEMIDRCQLTDGISDQLAISNHACFQKNVTAFFNQLVDNDENQLSWSALCLLDATYMINEAVTTAARNASQIVLVVKFLRMVAKVCRLNVVTHESLLCAMVRKLLTKNKCDQRQQLNLSRFVSQAVQGFVYHLDGTSVECKAILSPSEFVETAILPCLNSVNMLRSHGPITALVSTKLLHAVLTESDVKPDWLMALNPHAVLLCLCEMLEDAELLLADEDRSAAFFEMKSNLIENVDAILDFIKDNEAVVQTSSDWFLSKMVLADSTTVTRMARILPPPLNNRDHLQNIFRSFIREECKSTFINGADDGVNWCSAFKFAAISDDCLRACSCVDIEAAIRVIYPDFLVALTQVMVTLTQTEMKRIVSLVSTFVPAIVPQAHWGQRSSDSGEMAGDARVSAVLADAIVILSSEKLCPWVTEQLFHHAVQLFAISAQELCIFHEKVLRPDNYMRLLADIFFHICRLLATVPALFAEGVELLAMHIIQSIKAVKVDDNEEIDRVRTDLLSTMRLNLSLVNSKYHALEQQLSS